MLQLRSLAGFFLLAGLAWLLSEDRKGVNWRTVVAGMGLQVALGVVLVLNPASAYVFEVLNRCVLVLNEATTAGTSFVFGYLGNPEPPFAAATPGSYFVLAFQALPLILVVSALTSLLFYWRILPLVVRGFSWGLRRVLGVTGCEGLAAAANVFVGMVEAPLFIRPYLVRLTRGELFCVMTCGMATIAGTVMILYARFLQPVLGASALGHVLIASIISAPAAIVTARILVPESNPEVADSVDVMAIRSEARGSLDAIVRGTSDGVQIAINVCAMLIVAVALIYLIDACLGLLPRVADTPLSLQRVLGWCMAPLVWLIGVPWNEAAAAGGLMGLKTMANELLAYLALPAAALSERTNLVMTYAMCGFANFGSLGIMIGGMGTLAPERRAEIVQLGPKSILAGTLATMMTGAVVGMLV
ncbi:MAG: nucleoside transporter C-terminal domain-containing protein [Desulfobacterales bacterium]